MTLHYNTILYPTDEYTFYSNLDTLENNANFDSWECSLYHADSFVKCVENIVNLTKDTISASGYKFYGTFITPNIPNGCYYLIITDTVDSDNVLYLSNKLEVVSSTTDTYLIRYRNNQNILNFNYANLTSFKNKFRVPFIKRQPLNTLTTEGYDLINGNYKRVRTERVKTLELVTDYLDEDGHDAFQTALFHSDIEVFYDNKWNQYILADSSYEPEWSEQFEVSQATVRVEIANRSSTNKAV